MRLDVRTLCLSLLHYHKTSGLLLFRQTPLPASSGPKLLHTRRFHVSAPANRTNEGGKRDEEETALVTARDLFAQLRTKDKHTFNTAVELFHGKDKHARGHVEFIYSALRHMKAFGVHRDLDSYKGLVDIFPKGRFIPSNMWQVEFMHFPKQQQCAVDLLEQMEDFGVMPDKELNAMLENVFGTQGFPIRKLQRMAYWMPKFKNLSPWALPDPMPDSALELAKLAVQRITSVDLETKLSCYDTLELADSLDATWIVSGQSPEQQRLIEKHPADRAVYVEGAFRVWMQRVCINYFILRAEPLPLPPSKHKDPDDVGVLASMFKEDYVHTELSSVPSVHAQEDGVILGVCATGTSSRDSLLSWIRFLEQSNPRLGKDIAVLFTLKSPLGPTDELEIGSVAEEEAPRLRSFDGRTEERSSVKQGLAALDPADPRLSQLGVDETSDSRFPNWPQHFSRTGTRQEALRSGRGLSQAISSRPQSASTSPAPGGQSRDETRE